MTRVLLVVDGTDGARRAADAVSAWFGGSHVAVTAVNVARTPLVGVPQVPFGGLLGWPWPVTTSPADPVVELAMAHEQADAEAVAARQAPKGSTVEVVHGDPADAIVRAAEEVGADLIVVGSNHWGFLGRLMAKPLEERLVRDAPVPVLVVP